MQLIDNKDQFWKFWSVKLSLLSGLISATAIGVIGAYAILPMDWLPEVGASFKKIVAYSALIAGGMTAFLSAIARIVDQPKLRVDDTDQAGA